MDRRSYVSLADPMDEQLLTPPQVAERLQVNERTVTQWLRKGYLRGFKIGKEWRVSAADLKNFLNASANKPPDRSRSTARATGRR